MASEGVIPFGSPPYPLSDLGPCELSWSTPSHYSYGMFSQMWVFWSKYNDELEHVNPQLCASATFTDDTATKEKIKCILQKARPCYWTPYLLQFWGLLKIGDNMYLKTSDQPFALSFFNDERMEGLCEYRKLCLDYFIPVPEIIVQEEQLGPIGRVFYSGLPEFVRLVRHYSREECPLLYDFAVNRVKGYAALPVKLPPGNVPVGVLEIISPHDTVNVAHFVELLKDVGLYGDNTYDRISCSYYIRPHSCQEREIARINEVLRLVCKTHQVPLAQTWMLANSVKALAAVGIASSIRRQRLWKFKSIYWQYLIPPGQGVVGKAFSSKSACFCRDIKQLSIKEYLLVPNARQSGLSGCFAVCLQSSYLNNCTYTILEFFLPSDETNIGDPWTLLHMLMLTLMEQLQSSFKIASGQELGQKLFVEVIKVSSDDTLNSFEICHNSDSESVVGATEVHSARWMMPHDSSSDQQLDAVNDSVNVVHEQQIGIVGSLPALELVQNIVNITHQQSNAELNAPIPDRDDVSMEQSGNDAVLRKKGPNNTLESERGITREILERNSTKKLKDAAEHLGVSRSTLKRICRNNGICRWPPHKARKTNQAFPKQQVVLPFAVNIEEQCGSHATRLQECSSITVKAKYADYMIKFPLSFSSRKMDLEEKVVQRLNLPVGSFKIEYQDENDDWILVACDEDLSTTLSTFRSLGRTTLKMLVK